MKENFKIGQKIRLFRRSDNSNNFHEVDKAIIVDFLYNRGGDPIMCIVNTQSALEDGVIYNDVVPINTVNFYCKKY